jgi:cell fate regulator YaaT (PSP1 superfamily)
MAKMQKATLDPSKISGYCGRLKCCLRYEDKTYTELKSRLPRKSTIVKTAHGQGRVVDTQILTQLVMIEQNDGTKIAVPVEELEIISSPAVEAVEKEEQGDAAGSEGQDDQEDKKQ